MNQIATAGLDVTAILDAAPDGTILVDGSGVIVYANRRIAEMIGCAPRDLIGSPVERLVPAAVRAQHVRHRNAFQEHPHDRSMGVGLQLLASRVDGTSFPVEVSLSPLTPDGRVVIASVRDVTERTEAEADLRAAHESLVVAEERTRIAQDLHDTVIQRIFAAGLTLQSAIDLPTDKLHERVLRVVDDLDATIRDLRSAIFRLNREGHNTDLESELKVLIDEATGSMPIAPMVEITGLEVPVPDRIRRELLPSLREALTNAVKHAQAKTISIVVSIDSEVTMMVSDDGVGIAEGAPAGRGLVNLRTRALRLGGHCSISSGKTTGTQVIWAVPR